MIVFGLTVSPLCVICCRIVAVRNIHAGLSYLVVRRHLEGRIYSVFYGNHVNCRSEMFYLVSPWLAFFYRIVCCPCVCAGRVGCDRADAHRCCHVICS